MPRNIDTLLLASHNQKKARELRALLEPLGIALASLSDYPEAASPEETGITFEENALLKARFAADLTGVAALADDSGLVVEALGGEPGVRSARYAGENADDDANNALLLERMRHLPSEERQAFFVSVVALALPNGENRTWRGEAHGRILDFAQGDGGFGYDPLFFSNDLGKTFAEAGDAAKNRVSHRARALAAFAHYLREE